MHGLTHRKSGIGSHHSARMQNDEWLTPPHVLSRLGRFDLDPCAPVLARRPWNTADRHFTIEDNGHFHHADGSRAKANSGAPSVLIAYGQRDTEILSACGLDGHFIRLARQRQPADRQDLFAEAV
ncbi:hypothetical protein [Pseudothauera rhizosphaerae]|uniref:Uncharacterized protein n=1 Tax=Pseudothauera rhizosphaerae TaxID=2565932 RepID=A0A4S4AAK2_9RHOO|nr:hypothetical protein [Pseudothauera rhizosphaerae]THF55937.1 hypothetical protein E6O51_20335 [Pseudothauera rhizosphaerae]